MWSIPINEALKNTHECDVFNIQMVNVIAPVGITDFIAVFVANNVKCFARHIFEDKRRNVYLDTFDVLLFGR